LPIKTFQQILTEAVADVIEHGYDNPERIDEWVKQLREAASSSLGTPEEIEDKIRLSLRAIYDRNVKYGAILKKRNPKIPRFTLQNIEPMLRNELDKRIQASANLIKLNREKAIEQVLQRYSGWATSIPAGGSEAVDRREVKKGIAKSLKQMSFEERRVAVDQSFKLVSSISAVVAIQTNAIALEWHSHWRQAGYNYRPDHKDRDLKIYAIRDSWAIQKGLMNRGAGFSDEITQPGEEIFCRCFASYFTNLVDLPESMLTQKGRDYLND
jgi:hypothetical protein